MAPRRNRFPRLGAFVHGNDTCTTQSEVVLQRDFRGRGPASPRSCQHNSAHWANPVAPSGCPFGSNPDGLITYLPPYVQLPLSMRSPPFPLRQRRNASYLCSSEVFVFDMSYRLEHYIRHELVTGETVVKFDHIHVFGPTPAIL